MDRARAAGLQVWNTHEILLMHVTHFLRKRASDFLGLHEVHWMVNRLKDLYPASVKAMKYVAGLDEDGDGWPEGLGNVERTGMGEEKLDNAAYTIRGYADLADLAEAVGDRQTRRWAVGKAQALLGKFEDDWWYDADGARSYADSLDDPGNQKVFQRHWIGLTPTDAVLPELPGRPSAPRL